MRVTLLLVTILAGCANYGRVMHQGLAQPPAGRGIVVFSTGSTRPNIANATSLTVMDSTTRKERGTGVVLEGGLRPSDFEGQHGNVRSLMLDEGTYYFGITAVNPYYCIGARPLYRFRVKRGELIYLGSFLVDGSSLLHLSTEHRERDLRFFVQRNPALANVEIRPQPVELSRDSVGRCDR